MDDMTLRVGLEVETVLVSRYHWKLSLDKFAKRLTNEYNASVKGQGYSFMHTDIDGDYDGPAEYKEWSVTDDSTIATKSDSEYPIEIVAPIMFFNGQSGWRREVNHMFHVVNTLCKIGSNTSCGTHIHISPGLGDWSTGQLKSVCKAILYFESAFEVLVPESRRGNQWAKSNRFDNISFFGRNSQQCFALIEACENQAGK